MLGGKRSMMTRRALRFFSAQTGAKQFKVAETPCAQRCSSRVHHKSATLHQPLRQKGLEGRSCAAQAGKVDGGKKENA